MLILPSCLAGRLPPQSLHREHASGHAAHTACAPRKALRHAGRYALGSAMDARRRLGIPTARRDSMLCAVCVAFGGGSFMEMLLLPPCAKDGASVAVCDPLYSPSHAWSVHGRRVIDGQDEKADECIRSHVATAVTAALTGLADRKLMACLSCCNMMWPTSAAEETCGTQLIGMQRTGCTCAQVWAHRSVAGRRHA
jgi:hypothetical protein